MAKSFQEKSSRKKSLKKAIQSPRLKAGSVSNPPPIKDLGSERLNFEDSLKITLADLDFGKAEETAFVAFVSSVPKKVTKKSKDNDQIQIRCVAAPDLIAQWVTNECEKKQISGSFKECSFYRKFNGSNHLMVVGLGNSAELSPERLRQAVGHALKSLSSLRLPKVTLLAETALTLVKKKEDFLSAMTEGVLLATYHFDYLKSKRDDAKKIESVLLAFKNKPSASLKKAFDESLILSKATNFSRFLGDTPGNLMNPTVLAQQAQKMARGTRLKVTVWDKNRITKERMGAFLSVAQGSAQPPRLIIMEYKGNPTSKKRVCFVGKGLTFDSGGISIKPSPSMDEMKYDMCGGAAVIGTMMAISQMKLKINVVGLVPATENMPGPQATKPGDIFVCRNGKTVEVNNTDAEGRLILGDTIAYISEQNPTAIIDVATLTGAMSIALGNIYTGFFSRDEALVKTILKAAEQSGERLWRMPLCDEHSEDIKGTFADISNISAQKGAGSSTAAAFLEHFVGKGIPWVHFDIAGTAWHVGNRLPYCSKGASGVMVRTFVALATLLS